MRKWTEESARKVVLQSCGIEDKVIHLNPDSTRGLQACSAISYLCNHHGYKLV